MSRKKNKYLGVEGTQELINLFKASEAKKQDIVQFLEMPSVVEYVGRTVQYVGETTAVYTNGHFYHSTGFVWEEVYKGLTGKTWVAVDSVPSWSTADFDTIYFVVNEAYDAIGYIKGEETNQWYIVGGGSEGSWKIVNTLPSWATALDTQIYFIVDGDKLNGYVKNPDVPNQWYELGGGSETGWEIVAARPSWATASADIIYFVADGSMLKGYVKNPDVTNEWYELGGAGTINYNELNNAPTINGIPTQNTTDPTQAVDVELNAAVKKYPDSEHYDPSAVYPTDSDAFPVNELELEAFTDDEIRQVYEEV